MVTQYRNPLVTVDIIIEISTEFIMIERANPPHGWALPGGFVAYGDSLESSAIREAKEETSLDIQIIEQFHTYSQPDRDPRHHTVTTVFIASASGVPTAADDAKNLDLFSEHELPNPIVFDHERIINDYFKYKKGAMLRVIFSY